MHRRVFQDEPRRPRLHKLHEIPLQRRKVHHDDLRGAGLLLHQFHHVETVQASQTQIKKDHVRLQLPDLEESILVPSGRRHNLDVPLLSQDGNDPVA